MSRARAAALAAVLVAAVPAAARGDEPPPAEDAAKPWEAGTTAARREEALARFRAGNDRFVQRDYAGALADYEAALARYDHPRIRAQAVYALARLGRPADAHVHLDGALRWGAAPFEPDEYAELLDHQAAIERQVGRIAVRCTTEGARVTLDGQDLLACPGEATRVVMPGRHQVVGSRAGHLTRTEDVVAEAGQASAVVIALEPIPTRVVTHRRWAAWKPWAVAAGGVAIAAAGVPVQIKAVSDLDAFRVQLGVRCEGAAGCPGGVPAELADLEARALRENRIAISLWVVGGAVAAAGAAMIYLNRPWTETSAPDAARVTVTPVVGGGHVGVGVAGTF